MILSILGLIIFLFSLGFEEKVIKYMQNYELFVKHAINFYFPIFAKLVQYPPSFGTWISLVAFLNQTSIFSPKFIIGMLPSTSIWRGWLGKFNKKSDPLMIS